MSSVAMRSAVSTRAPRNLTASRRVALIAAPVAAPRVSGRRSIIVASDAKDTARDVVEQGKRTVQDGIENVKEGVDSLKGRAQESSSRGGADTQHQGSDGRFDGRAEMSAEDKDMGNGIPANTNYSIDDAYGKAREIKERNTGNSEPYAKEAAQNISDKAFGAADRTADRVSGAPERTENVVGGVKDAFANKFQEAKDAVAGQVNRDGQWLNDQIAGDGTENFGTTAIENVKKQARVGRQLADNDEQHEAREQSKNQQDENQQS